MQTAARILTLPRVLWLDAMTCAAMGAVLIGASSWLAELTDIPHGLLFWAGVVLVPIALFMAVIGLRPVALGVWLVIIGNVVWVAASGASLIGFIEPNPFGVGFILAQALAVAGLAWLEYAALRGRRRARA